MARQSSAVASGLWRGAGLLATGHGARVMNICDSTKGFLLDLDGVLYVEKQLVPGAIEALEFLRSRNLPFRFITNTSTQTPQALQQKLVAMGLTAAPDEIFSALSATVCCLQEFGAPSVHLVVQDAVKPAFAAFPQDSRSPDFVVLADIGAAWSYALLNQVFNLLMGGARLICLHRNKFWQTADGLHMDIGAFVAGLEYVTGATALVMGKPSAAFFHQAVASLQLPAHQVAVVGDDAEVDVGGGQAAGLAGILVQTGKYREALVRQSGITPQFTLPSIAELPALVLRQGW
jgi:HAD superfamily hydrolase (TIGR01458 family)